MSTTSSLKYPKFVSVEGSDIDSRSKPDGIRFSLVSYNILAQVYAKSSSFPHSPPACLKWKARSQAILALLKNLRADFLCLQELDEYDSFYRGNMLSNGYSSIYIQRSGQKRDGCGIFFKQHRAELILHEGIEYNDLLNSVQDENLATNGTKNNKRAKSAGPKNDSALKSTSQVRGDPNDPRVRLKRDCVGVMAAFKLRDSYSHVVIVASTHIYWDPKCADVKLAQAKYLLSRLAQFKTLVSNKFECKPSVVVAGDFNSTPMDKVYKYLVSGNSSSAPIPESLDNLPIPLCSVYASTRGEPKFTKCTPKFTNTLDYIFYSPSDYIKPNLKLMKTKTTFVTVAALFEINTVAHFQT